MFGKIKIKRMLLLLWFFMLFMIYIIFKPFDKVHVSNGSFFHRNLNGLSDKLSNWFEGQVLGISYEERFCKHMDKWTKENNKYSPIKVIAKQLSIKNGDSIFINGLHCGEWVVALKALFSNLKIYGVDKDSDSVEYVSKLANGTYKVSEPYELDKNGFLEKFDHAIIDGVLPIYSQELQCKSLTQTIPMLKAGGSLYIGKNFEQCEERQDIEKYLKENIHIQVLPKCFWSNICLLKRHDIAEILYSKVNNFMINNFSVFEKTISMEKKKEKLLIDFSSCATSVFIHKHIVFHSKTDVRDSHNLLPDSKYEHDVHLHKCTHSEIANSTGKNMGKFNKDKLKEAIIDMKINGINHIP